MRSEIDVGLSLMTITYKTYEIKARANRTPWTMDFGHNVRMKKPNERLKEAREKDGRYKSPSEVGDNVRDINKNTYISHENGNRDISKDAAERYAVLYGVTPGWILFNDPMVVPDGANPTMQKFLEAYAKAERMRRTIALDVALTALVIDKRSSATDEDEI